MIIAYTPGQRPNIVPHGPLTVASFIHWRSRHIVVEEIINFDLAPFDFSTTWDQGHTIITDDGRTATGVFTIPQPHSRPHRYSLPPLLTVRVPIQNPHFTCSRCGTTLTHVEAHYIAYCEHCDDYDEIMQFDFYSGTRHADSRSAECSPDEIPDDDIPF